MTILILGSEEDSHAAYLKKALTEKGIENDYLDSRQFPTQLKISWQPVKGTGSLVLPNSKKFNFSEIKSIFWRTYYGVKVPKLSNSYQQNIATNDSMGVLRSFMEATAEKWVNSWQAYQFHKEKPLQLGLANKIGVTIPATIVTNDAAEIIEFAESYPQVIFKPVYGGSHTQFLTKEHLDKQRLNLALSICPVTLQEYIPGTNIRSYVLGDKVYSAEIRSGSLDFREDKKAELIAVELPEDVNQQCVLIAQKFGLKWTGIDWRLKPNGEYVFLEANFSPMFVHFERKTGFPITDNLIDLLMG
jgi:glutathione synthase/RimK-type ligase-like ATP-grasp enzyme